MAVTGATNAGTSGANSANTAKAEPFPVENYLYNSSSDFSGDLDSMLGSLRQSQAELTAVLKTIQAKSDSRSALWKKVLGMAEKVNEFEAKVKKTQAEANDAGDSGWDKFCNFFTHKATNLQNEADRLAGEMKVLQADMHTEQAQIDHLKSKAADLTKVAKKETSETTQAKGAMQDFVDQVDGDGVAGALAAGDEAARA